MDEPKDRLRLARERAGFESMADAVRRFGWRYSSYAAHENGQNNISLEMARVYGRAFRVKPGWLLTGEASVEHNQVPLLGYVGAGFAIMPLGDSAELERVEPPPGVQTPLTAVKVRGNSMSPAYYDGDVIFYDHENDCRPPAELVGRECVVRLRDGRMFVKRIHKGVGRGRFLLTSYNSEPIIDAPVEWACPVKFIQRA